MTQIINNLFEISDRYDALFVDLWGCVHDGVKALPDAVTALQAYRNGGGKVPWEVLPADEFNPNTGARVAKGGWNPFGGNTGMPS